MVKHSDNDHDTIIFICMSWKFLCLLEGFIIDHYGFHHICGLGKVPNLSSSDLNPTKISALGYSLLYFLKFPKCWPPPPKKSPIQRDRRKKVKKTTPIGVILGELFLQSFCHFGNSWILFFQSASSPELQNVIFYTDHLCPTKFT